MGRLAPVPGIDPLFTDDDVDEILEWLAYEDSLCTGCYLPKAETFHPANEWAYEGQALQCHACAARERALKKLDVRDGVFGVVRHRHRREPQNEGR